VTEIPLERFWILYNAWRQAHLPVVTPAPSFSDALRSLYAENNDDAAKNDLKRNGWTTPTHLIRLLIALLSVSGELYSSALNMCSLLNAHASLRVGDADFGLSHDANLTHLDAEIWLVNPPYSVGARGGASSPEMTKAIDRCIALITDDSDTPKRAVLICPYEEGHAVYTQLSGIDGVNVLFTIRRGELSFTDGLAWDARAKLRSTPTTFDWAVIVFQNEAAHADCSLSLPAETNALVNEWAVTHCKNGASGLVLGDALTAALPAPTVPTLEEAALAAAAAVQTALLHRKAPIDASGAVVPLRVAASGHPSPLYAQLNAVPARAWQLAILPKVLTAASSALLTRRHGVQRQLPNKLIAGLATVWSAKQYQKRLPPRDPAGAGAAPVNVSKAGRAAIAHKWVSKLMKKTKDQPAGP
jgi:hypothetical protein